MMTEITSPTSWDGNEQTQQELNESIKSLKNYRDRLRTELISISQKLRMPKEKIDLTLKEHKELQVVESTLQKLRPENLQT